MLGSFKKIVKTAAKKKKVVKNKTKKALVVVQEKKLEMPGVPYKLTILEMQTVQKEFCKELEKPYTSPITCSLKALGDVTVCMTAEQMFAAIGTTPEALGPEKTAKYLTLLRDYEDQTVIEIPEPLEEDLSENHLTKQPYDVKELYALFYLYEEDRYQYYKIKIAASNIKAAGMGVYAAEDIPCSAIGRYTGIPRLEDDTNSYYSWVVKSFDPTDGIPDDHENYMYYIDATDFSRSNWTRYVNCGTKEAHNNMEQEQVYDKIFYTTTRDVAAGEEFFIDYGEEYRTVNLGMKPSAY